MPLDNEPLTAEELAKWKLNPTTKKVRQKIDNFVAEDVSIIKSIGVLKERADQTAQNVALLVGRIQGMEEFLGIEPDDK